MSNHRANPMTEFQRRLLRAIEAWVKGDIADMKAKRQETARTVRLQKLLIEKALAALTPPKPPKMPKMLGRTHYPTVLH